MHEEIQVPVSQEEIKAFVLAESTIIALSSKEHYIKIFPYSHKSIYIHTQKIPPHVLVYEQSDDLTFEDLICQYAREKYLNEQEQSSIQFTMAGGKKLDKLKKIQQIKRTLRLDHLDGLELYEQMLADRLYINECGIQLMMKSELFYNNKPFQIGFVLQDINYTIYIPIEGEQSRNNNELFYYVRDYISTEIKRAFGKDISLNMINLSFIQKQKEEQIINAQIQFSLLGRNDKVWVKFTESVKLQTLPHQNGSYLFIFGQGIKLNKFHYEYIKKKKLKDLLNQIELRPNWDQFGLKINDFVLKPYEKFQQAKHFMQNNIRSLKYYAGQIIPEALIFQAEKKQIKQIRQLNPFNIQQIIHPDKINQQLRHNIRQEAQQRATVQPILLYTSQLQIIQNNQNYSSSLYKSLNVFLRNQLFCLSTQEQYKNWEYSFANELLQQLKKIESVTDKVLWRGVSHAVNYNIGEIIQFKQFISTSKAQQKAKGFVTTVLFKITKSYSGRPIKQFSYYKDEDEVLFYPYVAFEVKAKSIIRKQLVIKPKIIRNKIILDPQYIILIELEEVKRDSMPDENVLYLLWVDDKTKEGLEIWNSLSHIKKTSVMIPLLSTEELQNWLQNNAQLLKDETVEFVMITNMNRKEKGIQKSDAGVEAIKVFRHFVPNGQIFVYIRQLEYTLMNLRNNNLNPDQLKVSNLEADLRIFLNQVAGFT